MAQSKPNSVQSEQTQKSIDIPAPKFREAEEEFNRDLREDKIQVKSSIPEIVKAFENEPSDLFQVIPENILESFKVSNITGGYHDYKEFDESIAESTGRIKNKSVLKEAVKIEDENDAIRNVIKSFQKDSQSNPDFNILKSVPTSSNPKITKWIMTLINTYEESPELIDTIDNMIRHDNDEKTARWYMQDFIRSQDELDTLKESFGNMVKGYKDLIKNKNSLASEAHMLFQKEKEAEKKKNRGVDEPVNPTGFWTRIKIAFKILKGKNVNSICKMYSDSIESYENYLKFKKAKCF